jgi:hypothetical protein
MMGYRTPNIDRIANEGVTLTDYYSQQSCTAGRACFITGQNPIRTGLTKVGMPGATVGLQREDPPAASGVPRPRRPGIRALGAPGALPALVWHPGVHTSLIKAGWADG